MYPQKKTRQAQNTIITLRQKAAANSNRGTDAIARHLKQFKGKVK